MSEPRKRGRPEGSKTADRAAAISLPAACPTCGSTRREPYRDGPFFEERVSGEIQGRPYTRVVWRHTRCADCGQRLTVREYLFQPEPRERTGAKCWTYPAVDGEGEKGSEGEGEKGNEN